MTDGAEPPREFHPPEPTGGDATGRFGPSPPPNVNVQVNAQNLHINPSNMAALERIVQLDPGVAQAIIRISGLSVRSERDRYLTGAICATVVCVILLVCAAGVIIKAGFWAGIAFFLACVVVAAVVAAIFTGKVQDLSWTARVIPGSRDSAKSKPDEAPPAA